MNMASPKQKNAGIVHHIDHAHSIEISHEHPHDVELDSGHKHSVHDDDINKNYYEGFYMTKKLLLILFMLSLSIQLYSEPLSFDRSITSPKKTINSSDNSNYNNYNNYNNDSKSGYTKDVKIIDKEKLFDRINKNKTRIPRKHFFNNLPSLAINISLFLITLTNNAFINFQ